MSNNTYAAAGGVVLPPNSHMPQHQAGPSSTSRRGGHGPGPGPGNTMRHHFNADLSQCLFDFVVQLLPTPEELAIKEDVRKLLERLIRNVEPDSRLLSFGSTANGFALRNSDMDLCCLIDSTEPPLSASELVVMVADLLERETKFQVKPLPKARIPIIKLSLAATQGLPHGIACDIGFENRLALENTRLLLSYATVDPTRVRTMVLFLKVWSKRRKINSPYLGTLSSYGYALLVIFFLIHVKNPPVLPNLQSIPPLRPISHEDMHIGEHNIWFFDDTELLKQKWQSSNLESVGELLVDFFRYYSHDFPYTVGVASIRGGLIDKAVKGWYEPDARGHDLSRDRNRLCIEDPFETSYNVGRTVTKDGLYTIRGEFMRASRIFSNRTDRAFIALSQLCEERDEELVRAPEPQPHGFVPPRVASFPAQSPYSVGTHFWRPTAPDRLSPPRPSDRPLEAEAEQVQDGAGNVPPHMAPKRQRWTSPPPPDAPSFEQDMYRTHLGIGISLATSSNRAREPSESPDVLTSSSGGSVTDDDLRSEAALSPTTAASDVGTPPNRWKRQSTSFGGQISPPNATENGPRSTRSSPMTMPTSPTPDNNKAVKVQIGRGRASSRSNEKPTTAAPPTSFTARQVSESQSPTTCTPLESPRRSFSGPPSIRMPPISAVAAASPPFVPSSESRSPVVSPVARPVAAADGEISPANSSGASSPVNRRFSQQPLAQLRPQAFPLYQSQTPTASPPQGPARSGGGTDEKLAKELSQLDLNKLKEKER